MVENIVGVFIVFVMGLIFGCTFMVINGKYINEAYDAVAECESTLPRNQTCKYVITAVPEVME